MLYDLTCIYVESEKVRLKKAECRMRIRWKWGHVGQGYKFMNTIWRHNVDHGDNSWGFPGGSDSEESACNAGDPDLILGLGRSLAEGNGYLLQYSCLENSIERGAWWATVFGVTKSWMFSL